MGATFCCEDSRVACEGFATSKVYNSTSLEPGIPPPDLHRRSINSPSPDQNSQNHSLILPVAKTAPITRLQDQDQDKIQQRQTHLLEYSSSIQHYKNFTPVRLRNVHDQLVSKDVFQGISILLFQLLLNQPSKFSQIYNKIIYLGQFHSLRRTIEQSSKAYGEVTEAQEILKLFLEYIVMLKEGTSAIEVAEKYTIIESVLQKIIISYMVSVNPGEKETIIQNYLEEEFTDEFISSVLHAFHVSHQWGSGKTVLVLTGVGYEATMSIKDKTITAVKNK